MKRQRQRVRLWAGRLGDIWSSDSVPNITVCGATAAVCPEAGGLCYMSVTVGGNGQRQRLLQTNVINV